MTNGQSCSCVKEVWDKFKRFRGNSKQVFKMLSCFCVVEPASIWYDLLQRAVTQGQELTEGRDQALVIHVMDLLSVSIFGYRSLDPLHEREKLGPNIDQLTNQYRGKPEPSKMVDPYRDSETASWWERWNKFVASNSASWRGRGRTHANNELVKAKYAYYLRPLIGRSRVAPYYWPVLWVRISHINKVHSVWVHSTMGNLSLVLEDRNKNPTVFL